MSSAAKKGAEVAAKAAATAVRRSVTAAEAKAGTSPPPAAAAASDTDSFMPWNGWFSSFLKDKIGAERYDSLRRKILYRPDDVHSLEQMPRPNTKVPASDTDPNLTVQFRHPSPGSQPPVQMPKVDLDEGSTQGDPYDVSYYKRDAGRRYTSDPANPRPDVEKIRLALLPQDDPRVKEAKEKFESGPQSSPGNKGVFATGKTEYDPKGLRATMSASNEALGASLDANMPDHLPTPNWCEDQDEIVAWYEERGLPVPIGGTGWGTVPREGRIARW